jgi:hypothetical protein
VLVRTAAEPIKDLACDRAVFCVLRMEMDFHLKDRPLVELHTIAEDYLRLMHSSARFSSSSDTSFKRQT